MTRPPFDPRTGDPLYAPDERVPSHEPLRHEDVERPPGCSILAWLALGVAIVIIAVLLVATAASRSGQTTADPSSQGGTTAGAGDTARMPLGSSAGQSGAPHDRHGSGLTPFGRAFATERRPLPAVAARAVFSPAGTLTGPATWYVWRAGQAAAGPRLRAALGSGWRGRSVSVCAARCVTVRLTDFCSCGHGRLIDLVPTAPATDVAP